MARRKQFTAEEAAAILTADTNTGISDLELSSESDSSVVDEDDVAPVLPDSDSDDTDVSVTSNWSESDDDDDNTMDNTIDTYYKTRDDAVKWKRNIRSQRGQPSSINIVDANSVGPTQLVPQNLESPLDTFNLTFPDECIELSYAILIKGTKSIVEQITEVPLFVNSEVTDPPLKRRLLPLLVCHLFLELIKLLKIPFATCTI